MLTKPLIQLITKTPPARLLAIDPGGSHVGYAIFTNGLPTHVGEQFSDLTTNLLWLNHALARVNPSVVVCESYHIYKTHINDHINSDVPTLQYIGAIKYACLIQSIPIVLQSAMIGKAYPTDARLKDWNLYNVTKSPHGRDALRHGISYLIKHKNSK